MRARLGGPQPARYDVTPPRHSATSSLSRKNFLLRRSAQCPKIRPQHAELTLKPAIRRQDPVSRAALPAPPRLRDRRRVATAYRGPMAPPLMQRRRLRPHGARGGPPQTGRESRRSAPPQGPTGRRCRAVPPAGAELSATPRDAHPEIAAPTPLPGRATPCQTVSPCGQAYCTLCCTLCCTLGPLADPRPPKSPLSARIRPPVS